MGKLVKLSELRLGLRRPTKYDEDIKQALEMREDTALEFVIPNGRTALSIRSSLANKIRTDETLSKELRVVLQHDKVFLVKIPKEKVKK